MELTDRRYVLAWLVLLGLIAASAGLTTYRLSGLPNLGMKLGPDLQVRSVVPSAYPQSESPKFTAGDFFVALEGSTLNSLRDLRVVLRSLPGDEKYRGEGEEDGLRYQLLRRVHRYTISWQGDRSDPTELPPGYNPETDVLVEIDGRQLPEAVGPEGVRSVLGHRSNALLTFERHNAVFQGEVTFWPASWTWSIPLTFGIGALLVLGVWRFRSREIPVLSSVAVGVEILALGWILLLAIAYQWTLADRLLASLTIVGLIAVRPLAIFARSQAARDEGDAVGWWALGLGAGYAALVIGSLHGDLLRDAETGLYAGACGTVLYLIYEMFAAAFDDAPHTTLQEGGGYLAGILMVGSATAIFIWQFETAAFRFELWRWFVIAFTALIGIGDLFFCLRGPSGVGYGELATTEERRRGIRRYLESVAEQLRDARLRVVVRRADRQHDTAVTISCDSGRVEFEPTPERVRDLVSILVREESRIPLPGGGEGGNHPLSGLAHTMDVVLALRLRPPPGGMELRGTDVVLLATRPSGTADLPSFASAETIDFVQRELSPSAWGALFVEGMSQLPLEPVESDERGDDESSAPDSEEAAAGPSGPDSAPSGGESPAEDDREVDERVGELSEELERAEQRVAFLREDRRSLAEQLQMADRRLRNAVPPTEEYERLLEPELIETIEFLLESDEPIAVGGPFGAGKEFTARCAAEIEGKPPESFVVYDAFAADNDDHRDALFGDEDSGEPGFVDTASGASLFVRAAGRLSDTILIGLCNAATERGIRVFLSFREPDIEARSPLEERPPRVAEMLEHRELMIPSLRRRPSVLPNILNYYRNYYGHLRNITVESFSEEALAALRAYDYPAEIREAKLLVDLAVMRSGGGRVELGDLNREVRGASQREDESGPGSPES